MLVQLYIQNFALIEDAKIDFKSGFSVITGETGSGKSILLDALNLLLGKRAELDAIRSGAEKCVIEGVFDVSKYQFQAFFQEQDIDYDNECIIRREISTNGKSRAFVNDTPVVLSVLKNLGEILLDVHSQNANLLLESPWFYYDLLDGFAGVLESRKDYFDTYKTWLEQKKTLEEKEKNKAKSTEELEFKLFQYNELKAANFKREEQNTLEDELEVLGNAEKISSNLSESLNLLSENEASVMENLAAVVHKISALATYRPEFQLLSERLTSVNIELKDIESELNFWLQKSDLNPAELEKVENRLALLYSLLKKYSMKEVEGLLEKQQILEQEINDVVGGEERIEELKQEISKLETILKKQADELTKQRQKAATLLEKEILNDLFNMNMKNAQLKIEVKNSTFNTYGNNEIIFAFNANRGGNLQVLSKVASGGELSRVMLSLKRVLSLKKKLPTILFDEIDTGVSGEVADKMAEIMKEMAAQMQVISITHLPQIASKGQFHYKVFKTDTVEQTISEIKALSSKEDRIMEIAQMLSGAKVSPEAINNAKSLLG